MLDLVGELHRAASGALITKPKPKRKRAAPGKTKSAA
jgi:hypothetical protein